jgi:hypothetical protein
VDGRRSAEVPLPFGRFLGEDVAQKRLGALHPSASLDAKPFGRALLGLHFWHRNLVKANFSKDVSAMVSR